MSILSVYRHIKHCKRFLLVEIQADIIGRVSLVVI